jgi:hypothetical protein
MPKNNKKKTSPAKKIVSAAKRVVTKTVTEVRNTPIPKIAAKKSAAPRVVTHDDIAKRAYEIHLSSAGGTEADNWYRAERELRGL